MGAKARRPTRGGIPGTSNLRRKPQNLRSKPSYRRKRPVKDVRRLGAPDRTTAANLPGGPVGLQLVRVEGNVDQDFLRCAMATGIEVVTSEHACSEVGSTVGPWKSYRF